MAVYRRASRLSVKKYAKPAMRKRYGNRALKSKPTSINRGLSIANGISGFPDSIRTTLKYHQDIGITSASGVVNGNTFRANSCFDPDETGTGHQPMYFDQLAAVYGRYQVVSSYIRVTFTPITETAGTSNWLFGIVGQNSNGLSSNPNTLCEGGHSKYKVVNGRLGGPNQCTLTLKYTPEACLGLTYKDTDVGALVTANPDQSYKFIPWGADMNATGTTNAVASVDVIYDVVFSLRLNTAGS